jgi:hypothetical protein
MKKTASTPRRRSSVEQRLCRYWREFIDRSHAALEQENDKRLHAVTEKFRTQVAAAAAAGVETSVTWFSLGLWTFDNDERILCFGRALKCIASEEARDPAMNDLGRWTFLHYKALCRFEIARALENEGRPDDAKQFLLEALPYARAAEDMPVRGETFEGNLEGRIAGELMLLEARAVAR